MNIISKIKLIVSGYPEDQIIEVLGKTGYANVKDTRKLVTKYLEYGYPLSNIDSRGILSAICDSILDANVSTKLLEKYALQDHIKELSVFDTERYRPLLKHMVRYGIEPYEIIKRFNLSDLDKDDLFSLKANELYELYNSSKKKVFVKALEDKDIVDLLELYRTTKGKRDEKVSHMIIDRAYNVYKGCSTSYIDPEDMPYLANKFMEEKDLVGILNIYGKFEPDNEPRKKLKQFLVGSKQISGGEKELNDDGEFTYKVLTTVQDLTEEEIKSLNNKMNNCPNTEYRIYWMFDNKTQEELEKIDKDIIIFAIAFLQNDNKCTNKELSKKVLNLLLETQGETVTKFIDEALNSYNIPQRQSSDTNQVKTSSEASANGSRKGFFKGFKPGK